MAALMLANGSNENDGSDQHGAMNMTMDMGKHSEPLSASSNSPTDFPRLAAIESSFR